MKPYGLCVGAATKIVYLVDEYMRVIEYLHIPSTAAAWLKADIGSKVTNFNNFQQVESREEAISEAFLMSL